MKIQKCNVAFTMYGLKECEGDLMVETMMQKMRMDFRTIQIMLSIINAWT